ncbi:SDR family oxidoreductase [Beijerinckia sp. L45]|uniref:SDR family oxidoreductase n=1 Tax=Beijerinckia sp. L45 TaxID=1641855 RepID=UPI00131BF338|nr:SDR family oxidoreductase [Beijerinckia sp. L45]
MIIVTGATGQLGRQIVEQLLDLLPVDQVVATTRDPAKAADIAARRVQVRRCNFAEPDTLASAFEGASQVLMVSSNAQAYGGDSLAQHRAAIEAARAAGVRRIVYTSHMGADAGSAFLPARVHAATEQMLSESGLAWTALRNGFYANTVTRIMGAAASGVIETPQDGKVSWTDRGDLAAAAAQVLMQESRFEGPTPPLTALQALDFADVAVILTDLHGRPVEWRMISDEEEARRITANGAPPIIVDLMLGMYRAARAGEFTAVDPTLATLLSRSPTTLHDVLAAADTGGRPTS